MEISIADWDYDAAILPFRDDTGQHSSLLVFLLHI